MNSRPISSYEDLCREKERLTELLKGQKAQITRDLEELKAEFKPMVSLSENVGKFLTREDGKDPLVTAGTNIGIDILVSRMFSRSNFFLKLVLPAVLKNVSSYFIPKAHPHFRKPTSETTVVERTVVREQKPVNSNGRVPAVPTDNRPGAATSREDNRSTVTRQR